MLDVILCSAVILVFSVNDLQSYINIFAKWIPQVRRQCPSAPAILVGNKTDLREKDNETVSREMGMQLARVINAVAYFECSCRNGRTATIKRIFETAARASYFVKVEKFLKKSNKTLLIKDQKAAATKAWAQYLYLSKQQNKIPSPKPPSPSLLRSYITLPYAYLMV